MGARVHHEADERRQPAEVSGVRLHAVRRVVAQAARAGATPPLLPLRVCLLRREAGERMARAGTSPNLQVLFFTSY